MPKRVRDIIREHSITNFSDPNLHQHINNKLETQSILVTNLESQVFNYQTIIDQKDLQLGTSSELTEELNKQLMCKVYTILTTMKKAKRLLLEELVTNW